MVVAVAAMIVVVVAPFVMSLDGFLAPGGSFRDTLLLGARKGGWLVGRRHVGMNISVITITATGKGGRSTAVGSLADLLA